MSQLSNDVENKWCWKRRRSLEGFQRDNGKCNYKMQNEEDDGFQRAGCWM
jgi:hypothetical protein